MRSQIPEYFCCIFYQKWGRRFYNIFTAVQFLCLSHWLLDYGGQYPSTISVSHKKCVCCPLCIVCSVASGFTIYLWSLSLSLVFVIAFLGLCLLVGQVMTKQAFKCTVSVFNILLNPYTDERREMCWKIHPLITFAKMSTLQLTCISIFSLNRVSVMYVLIELQLRSNFWEKSIIANVPYYIQKFPDVLQKYSLK